MNTENNIHYTIKNLPANERPRERLIAMGPDKLSEIELLAIVIKTGTQKATAIQIASSLLARYSNLRKISTLNVKELSAIKGIGTAKASQILAALELGKRIGSIKDIEKVAIKKSEDVFHLLKRDLSCLKKEVFKAVLLNTKNEIIKVAHISEGTVSASLVHPRETFKTAIYEVASAIILVHNHPSGDSTPSEDDIKLTSNFLSASKIIGIDVIDHIIIGDENYISLRESGLIQQW